MARSELAGRPLLSTPQGGRVVLDAPLLALWETAEGRSLADILADPPQPAAPARELRAGLASLAEAGLLERLEAPPVRQAIPPPDTPDEPLVSAILVGFNSREWLEISLPSIYAQSHPALEIIVVDNASTDGTAAWLQAQYPRARLVRLEAPTTLADALNHGAAEAAGDYFLFLNPDVELDPHAVRYLLAAVQRSADTAAAAAKLRFRWAPAFLNGLGNRVGPFSWGTDNGLGHLDLGQFDGWEQVPSACLAAALVARQAWESVGPLDAKFPLYYEDNEWSYRARQQGYIIRAAPQAVILHAFSGRVPDGRQVDMTPAKLRQVVYGRLRFALRLAGRSLPRFLGAYLLEDLAGLALAAVRLRGGIARAYIGAWQAVLADLPDIRQSRRQLAAGRRIPDRVLFRAPPDSPPLVWRGLPELTWDLVRNHYGPLMWAGRTRMLPEAQTDHGRPSLLIISHDIIGPNLAGPGMRYLEMARALGRDFPVTLAAPDPSEPGEVDGVALATYSAGRPAGLEALAGKSDVILASLNLVEKFPFLSRSGARLVVDFYDPFLLENLHYYHDQPLETQLDFNRSAVAITNRLARSGDFYICSSERQRDFWLGVLAANGRVNPHTYSQDPALRSLIDVVGVGFPSRPPRPGPYLKGRHPAVPEGARIVLWGGGIWNWLDPLTLLRAWPEVLADRPEARLVFLGLRHPNPMVPRHRMADRAEALAAEIGEKDRSVIFIEWLPFEDREALLSEADLGATLHPVHIETRYALRTRVLDYFWARLPVLITEGDVTADWVQQFDLGVVAPPDDAGAVASAIKTLLAQDRSHWRDRYDPLQEIFRWENVVAPLRRYCLEGSPAPDRQASRQHADGLPDADSGVNPLRRGLAIAQSEGIRAALHRGWRYLQWRLAR